MAVTGLTATRPPRPPRPRGARLRRLHRTLGLAVLISVLFSTVSGVLHVVMTWTQAPPPSARPQSGLDPTLVQIGLVEAVQRAGRDGARLDGASLRSIGGRPYWQLAVSGEEGPTYVDAASGVPDADADARYAAEIASAFLGGLPVRQTARLTAYDAEYISIFRILPVFRMDADDGQGTRVYVSTQTGSVTRHTDDWRQFEADLFSNLHKLAFIPFKGLRDGVLATLTGGILIAAGLGFGLWLRTAWRSRNTR